MDGVLVSIKALPNYKGLHLPSYATIGSAGVDLLAAIEHDITLESQQRFLVPSGIAISLPSGFEAQVRSRSGLAIKNGISVLNSPGTIDSDYRGEIKICLINLSNDPFIITRGMRIAQMIVSKYETVNWNIVEILDDTSRSSGGFGSTGI